MSKAERQLRFVTDTLINREVRQQSYGIRRHRTLNSALRTISPTLIKCGVVSRNRRIAVKAGRGTSRPLNSGVV